MRTVKVKVIIEVTGDTDDDSFSEAVRDAVEDAIDAHDFGDEPLEYEVEEDGDEDF